MKKSLLLLGAFVLLIAAPTFAQNETAKAPVLAKKKAVKIEKTQPVAKTPVAKKQSVKAEFVKKEDIKSSELKKAQELKAVEPKLIEEK
jgi:hypothetical protein